MVDFLCVALSLYGASTVREPMLWSASSDVYINTTKCSSFKKRRCKLSTYMTPLPTQMTAETFLKSQLDRGGRPPASPSSPLNISGRSFPIF